MEDNKTPKLVECQSVRVAMSKIGTSIYLHEF